LAKGQDSAKSQFRAAQPSGSIWFVLIDDPDIKDPNWRGASAAGEDNSRDSRRKARRGQQKRQELDQDVGQPAELAMPSGFRG
jgi:hypothetical protein